MSYFFNIKFKRKALRTNIEKYDSFQNFIIRYFSIQVFRYFQSLFWYGNVAMRHDICIFHVSELPGYQLNMNPQNNLTNIFGLEQGCKILSSYKTVSQNKSPLIHDRNTFETKCQTFWVPNLFRSKIQKTETGLNLKKSCTPKM